MPWASLGEYRKLGWIGELASDWRDLSAVDRLTSDAELTGSGTVAP